MKKFIKRTCLFLFLFISCEKINGQIINQKGIFISYEVVYKYSEDYIGSFRFIEFIDSMSRFKLVAKMINILNSDSVYYSMNKLLTGKKIYDHFGLYLNSIYRSSDSLQKILKTYTVNLDIDSLISKNLIYNKQFCCLNKDQSNPSYYEYRINISLFYGDLTYFDYKVKEDTPGTIKWGWDSINKAYLCSGKPLNETVGVILKWDY